MLISFSVSISRDFFFVTKTWGMIVHTIPHTLNRGGCIPGFSQSGIAKCHSQGLVGERDFHNVHAKTSCTLYSASHKKGNP